MISPPGLSPLINIGVSNENHLRLGSSRVWGPIVSDSLLSDLARKRFGAVVLVRKADLDNAIAVFSSERN